VILVRTYGVWKYQFYEKRQRIVRRSWKFLVHDTRTMKWVDTVNSPKRLQEHWTPVVDPSMLLRLKNHFIKALNYLPRRCQEKENAKQDWSRIPGIRNDTFLPRIQATAKLKGLPETIPIGLTWLSMKATTERRKNEPKMSPSMTVHFLKNTDVTPSDWSEPWPGVGWWQIIKKRPNYLTTRFKIIRLFH